MGNVKAYRISVHGNSKALSEIERFMVERERVIATNINYNTLKLDMYVCSRSRIGAKVSECLLNVMAKFITV